MNMPMLRNRSGKCFMNKAKIMSCLMNVLIQKHLNSKRNARIQRRQIRLSHHFLLSWL